MVPKEGLILVSSCLCRHTFTRDVTAIRSGSWDNLRGLDPPLDSVKGAGHGRERLVDF